MRVLFYLIVAMFALPTFGQKIESESPSDSHIDHHNHVGLATGPVYILNESEFAPGLLFHYMRLLEAGNAHFGIGLGLEAIFDEHRHYATSLNLS